MSAGCSDTIPPRWGQYNTPHRYTRFPPELWQLCRLLCAPRRIPRPSAPLPCSRIPEPHTARPLRCSPPDPYTCRRSQQSSPPWRPRSSTHPERPDRPPWSWESLRRPSGPCPDSDPQIPAHNSGGRSHPLSPWYPLPSAPRQRASSAGSRWSKPSSCSCSAPPQSRPSFPQPPPRPLPPPWPPLSPPQRAGRASPLLQSRPHRRSPLPRPHSRPRDPPAP